MKNIKRILWQMGFGSIKQAIFELSHSLAFFAEYFRYRRLCRRGNLSVPKPADLSYYPYDKTAKTSFDRHYLYHCAWAARVVRKLNPSEHVDISSSLMWGAIISAYVPFRFYDYRPAEIVLDNYQQDSVDLLSLPFPTSSIKSLSCMHVV